MARRRTGPGSRARRGFVANTKAPRASYAIKPGSAVGGRGRGKYPITSINRARSALRYVSRFGSPQEKKLVKAAVRRKYPALAKRSTVIATPGTRKRRPATRARRTTRRRRTRARSRR